MREMRDRREIGGIYIERGKERIFGEKYRKRARKSERESARER